MTERTVSIPPSSRGPRSIHGECLTEVVDLDIGLDGDPVVAQQLAQERLPHRVHLDQVDDVLASGAELGVVVAFSVIYTGDHWLHDCIAGAAFAYVAYYIVVHTPASVREWFDGIFLPTEEPTTV